MALTQISTKGIKDGTITGTDLATSFATTGDFTFTGANYNVVWNKASNLFQFADSAQIKFGTDNDMSIRHGSGVNIIDAITSNLEIKHGSENIAKFIPDGAVELYYDNSKKFETTSGGVTVTGQLTVGLNSTSRIEMFHFGNTNFIRPQGGSLDIITPNNTNIARFIPGGAVELWHNSSKKLETTSTGVSVTGQLSTTDTISTVGNLDMSDSTSTGNNRIMLGTGDDLQIFHDGNNSVVRESGTGQLQLESNTNIVLGTEGIGETYLKAVPNGTVELYHNNSKKLETTSSGATVTGSLGIGTTSPNYELQVNDPSGTISVLQLTNTTTGTAAGDGLLMYITGNDTIISNEEAGYMRFQTSGTERMRIDSSGNVGIGTSSPATQLEVKDSTDSRITITAGNAISQAGINFADNGGVDGIVTFDHNTRKLHLGAGTSSFTDGDLTIDSSGNVGIGTTSPDQNLSVVAANSATPRIGLQNPDYAENFNISSYHDANGIYVGIGANAKYLANGNMTVDTTTHKSVLIELDARNNGAFVVYTGSTGGNPSERWRVTEVGQHYFNTTSSLGSGVQNIDIGGVSSADILDVGIRIQAHESGNHALHFQNPSSTTVGKIIINSGSTTYSTNSDYRLKENVVAIFDGITRLKTLKPYRFNFINDKGTTVDGFLAHEVTAVPEAIDGTKDEVDKDNNPVYQGIDQSKLVPLLVAALQEAITKIEVLETEVAALKAS